jgi:hypothetical protein
VAESRPGVANSPTVHPIYSDPIVTQRPVLALGQPILDRHRDFIPILSFDGVPGTPTSTVQVRIYQDTLLPADELLDDDPIALREIEQATGVSINSPDPMDRLLVASFGRIMAAENRTGFVSPRRGSAIDLSGVGGEDQDEAPSHHATVSVDDLLPELPETTTSVPEAHSAAPPPAPGDDHATPVVQADGADQPAWLKALAAEWPKSNPIIRLVAVVWLWMRDQPDAENLVQVHGTELRICVHWFEERMRGRLLNDLYSRKLDASIITTNWPSLGLNITVRRLVVSTNGSEPFGVVRGNARDEIVKFGGPQS